MIRCLRFEWVALRSEIHCVLEVSGTSCATWSCGGSLRVELGGEGGVEGVE